VGSGSERLVSSDVGKRHCDCDNGVLSFRKSEAKQEKLESAVLIVTPEIPAIYRAISTSSMTRVKQNVGFHVLPSSWLSGPLLLLTVPALVRPGHRVQPGLGNRIPAGYTNAICALLRPN
jgi:hypothetical protein